MTVPAGCCGGLRTLLGGKAEYFGMGTTVVLGQRLAEGAAPVGHGPLADLAAGDRKLGDSRPPGRPPGFCPGRLHGSPGLVVRTVGRG